MDNPTKLNGTLHPIFKDVKVGNLQQIKPARTLLVLKLRKEGYSFSEIARRLYAEHNIALSSQQIGKLCQKYYKKFIEAGGKA